MRRRINPYGLLAIESAIAAPAEVADLTLAEEGWKGALLGAVGGLFFGGLHGGLVTHEIEKKKVEVEHLARELEKVAVDHGKKAVKEGKLSAEDFKKNVDVGIKGVIRGAIFGTLFGPFHGAIAGSELEDLKKELEQQCKQLNTMLEAEAKRQGKKIAHESADDSATPETDKEVKDDKPVAEDKPKDEKDGKDTKEASADDAPAAEIPAADDVPAADAPAADAAATDAPADAAVADDAAAVDAPAGDAAADAAATDVAATDDAPAAETPPVEVNLNGEPLKEVTLDGHPLGELVVDHSEDAEMDLAQGTEEGSQVEGMADATADAVEVTSALESIAEVLRGTLSEGGLSKADATAVFASTHALYDSVGLRRAHFPSLESFNTVSGRLRATKLAMESMVEAAKKIWAKIIAALKAAVKWVVERFELFWFNAEKLTKRADDLIKHAEALKGSPKEKEFHSAALIHALHLNGKVKPLEAGDRLGEAVSKVLSPNHKFLPELLEVLKNEKEDLDVEHVAKNLLGFMDLNTVVKNPKEEGLSVKEGFELFRQSELPGGKCLLGEFPGDKIQTHDNVEAAALLQQISVKLVDGWPKIEASEDQKLDVLTPSDIVKLGEGVKKVCAIILEFKKAIESSTKTKEEIIAQAEKLSQVPGDNAAALAARTKGKIAVWAVHTTDVPAAGFTLYALKTLKSLLDYGVVSAKQYGAAEEKQSEKPAEAAKA